MKSQLMFMGVAMGLSVGAADLTINEPTTYNANVTVGNVFANANIQVGDTASSIFTISSSKYVYLPGADGKSSRFWLKCGKISVTGNSAGFKIGEYPGWGYLNIDDCGSDVTLGRVEVRDGSTASSSGYVDLRVANGRETSGHWHRLFLVKLLNYRSATKPSLRVLFNGKGAALAPNSNCDGNLMYVQSAKTKTVLEAEGGCDIVFLNGSWWTSPKTLTILQPESQGILRTQGDCDVIFHNHSAGGEANVCPTYVFQLAHSTNQYEWAHSGMTVVSNACMLATTVDYALPNGPQTGPLCFEGTESNYGNPWLDLKGTKQIINGIRNGLGSRTYQGVTDIRSVITNSSETVAELTVRNETDESFVVGYLKDRIKLRKEGTGSLGVSRVRMSRNDIEVTAGELVLSNMWETVLAGTVTVSGGTLIVDGCVLDCTALTTSGAGGVRCRNGGRITGTISQDVNFVAESITNTAFCSAAELDGAGCVSVVKTGDMLLTFVPGTHDLGTVDVRDGTLRPVCTASSADYWRFTFTETIQNDDITVRITQPETGDKQIPILIRPSLSLGRLHLFSDKGRADSDIGYAGKDVSIASLAGGQGTANMAYVTDIKGFGTGTQGGVAGSPMTLHGSFANWYTGVIFTNRVAELSDSNPLVYTFRLPTGRTGAAGYLFSKCVNNNSMRPYSWKVEASVNGTDWVIMDERTHVDGADKGPSTYGHDGVPFLFSSFANSWQFKPSGAVKVAAGATLDTTEIPDANIAISRLGADYAAGAGTITKFVPSENGVFELTNAPANLEKVELFTCGSIIHGERLESWQVSINGEIQKSYVVKVTDQGKLCVKKLSGCLIIFK